MYYISPYQAQTFNNQAKDHTEQIMQSCDDVINGGDLEEGDEVLEEGGSSAAEEGGDTEATGALYVEANQTQQVGILEFILKENEKKNFDKSCLMLMLNIFRERNPFHKDAFNNRLFNEFSF